MRSIEAALRDKALAGCKRAMAFPCVRALVRAAEPIRGDLAIIGGAVRDWMLDAKSADIDFLFTGDPDVLHKALAASGMEARNRPKFRTMSFHCEGIAYDIAFPRRDDYPVPGGEPRIEPAGLEEDALRRDFTSNCLRIFVTEHGPPQFSDPLSGLADIANGLLRPVTTETLSEDPVRILRGARYLRRFDWVPAGSWQEGLDMAREPSTWKDVAAGRLWHEARSIADEPDPSLVWHQLHNWQVDRALLGIELDETVLQALRTWRKFGAERLGTGRNWLCDLWFFNHAHPELGEELLRRWDVPTSTANRWRKFQRRVDDAIRKNTQPPPNTPEQKVAAVIT